MVCRQVHDTAGKVLHLRRKNFFSLMILPRKRGAPNGACNRLLLRINQFSANPASFSAVLALISKFHAEVWKYGVVPLASLLA